MSDPAGRLNIALQRGRSGLTCRIASTRPVTAARVFVGRTPLDVAGLVPMLFSVCARAQSCACSTALEQALGQPASPAVASARRRSVLVERLREHLWRILLDWPALIGEPADRETMQAVTRRTKILFDADDPDGTLFRPGGATGWVDRVRTIEPLAELGSLLARRVLGMPASEWLDVIGDAWTFRRWAESTETGAARLMRTLAVEDTGALGRSSVGPLPDLGDAELQAAMTGPGADDFIARPTWAGEPRETSPFARQAGSALLRDLAVERGNGILPRLAAQLREVALALAGLDDDEAAANPRADPAMAATGCGLGRADAARGLLVHLAQVDDGRVQEYRILAPTEWNCHPHGILAQGLAGLPAADDSLLRRWAELLIISTDPCIAYELTISTTHVPI